MADKPTLSRREWLRAAGGAVAAGLAGCSDGGSGANGSPNWTLVAPRLADGSLITQIMKGIRGQVRDSETRLTVELAGTDFTDSGVRALGAGDLDLTAAPQVYGYAGYHGEAVSGAIDYSGDAGVDRRPVQLFDVYTTRVWWVTKRDDVRTFGDLAGATVGVPPESATSTPEPGSLYTGMLEAAGVLGDVEVVETLYVDLPAALDAGDVDVAPNLLRGPTAPSFMSAHGDVRPVEPGEDRASSFEASPFGTLTELDLAEVDAYGSDVEGTTRAMTYDVGLFAATDVDAEPARAVTELSLENADELRIVTEEMMDFSKERAADLSPDVPVHEGAAQYLKEADLWSEELSSTGDDAENQ